MMLNALPRPRKYSRLLTTTGIAALVTACGFVATPSLWKNWVSDENSLIQTNLRSTLDAQGNTWHEFQDADGVHLRLVDSNGTEQWRQTLATTVDTIAAHSGGAVLVGNSLLTAIDIDGNTRWSQSIPARAKISVDAQNRVVVVSVESHQITVTGISGDGVQRWQRSFNATEDIAYSLVTTRNDGTSVILYETGASQSSLATRTIDSEGILGAERIIGPVDLTIGSIPWLATNGDNVMAFTHGTLYGFNDDGSMAWKHSATPATEDNSHIVGCSNPGAERTVCHTLIFNQSRLEWINNAGRVVSQKTIKTDSVLALIGNGLDRWVLVDVSAPDELSGAGVLSPKPQHVVRMHVFDETGERTGTLNMEPADVFPAQCLGFGCTYMSFKEPAEFYFNGGVTEDKVIVTGALMQDTLYPHNRLRSFIAAYDLK